MMFGSPERQYKHHQTQNQQHQSWDTPNTYPVYAVIMQPMPMPADKLPLAREYPCPYDNVTFNNKYAGYQFEDPRRSRVVEYERAPVHARASDYRVDEEDVDAEAEQFIKHEHNKFKLSKTIKSYD